MKPTIIRTALAAFALAGTLAHGVQLVDNRSRGQAVVALSSIVGAEAVDVNGVRLGRVEEVFVDATNKRLSHGVAGTTAIDFSAGVMMEDGRLVALPPGATPPGRPRELHRATEILEARVVDWSGREIAELHEVVIARKNGRIRHAVVSLDEGWGHPERRIAIRMPAVSYERLGSDDVVLIASRRELDEAHGVDMRGIQ